MQHVIVDEMRFTSDGGRDFEVLLVFETDDDPSRRYTQAAIIAFNVKCMADAVIEMWKDLMNIDDVEISYVAEDGSSIVFTIADTEHRICLKRPKYGE